MLDCRTLIKEQYVVFIPIDSIFLRDVVSLHLRGVNTAS
jgi:hypothetical protein